VKYPKVAVVDVLYLVKFNEGKLMARDRKERRKRSDRRRPSTARQDLRAAESLVRQSGNRLAIGDAHSRIRRARADREKRQAERKKQ
jgi:hypothetical protein